MFEFSIEIESHEYIIGQKSHLDNGHVFEFWSGLGGIMEFSSIQSTLALI
jgi:hypothetical protein